MSDLASEVQSDPFMEITENKSRRLIFRPSDWLPEIGRYGVLIFFALIILVPLGLAFLNGLKSNAQVLAHPFALPKPALWSNYGDLLHSSAFWRQTGNSVLVMVSTTLLVIALGSGAAFVFARIQFRGKNVLFTFYVLGLLFPITVAILPVYLLVRRLGLVDTLWGLVLPQVAFLLPLAIVILRNFFLSVPTDLEDASYVDGAGPFEFFFRVLLPLVRPGLAAVAVLTMVFSWNAFFLPLIVINTESRYTLPLGTMQFQGQFGSDWGRILAFVSLSMIPAVAFYVVAERQIVAGLTAGSLKG
jgi:raffinose/stachyose/melibiose transport system permease protein